MNGSSQRLSAFLTFALIVLLAVVLLIWLVRGLGGPQRPYSSLGAHPGGAKAFYLLLEETGYDVARWNGPFQRLPFEQAGQTLIITEPSRQGVSEREAEALRRWVEAGNRVLLLSAGQPALLQAFGLEAEYPESPNQVVLTLPESGHPVMEGVSRMEINRTAYFTNPAGGEPLIESGGEIYALYQQVGSGELIAVSDPDLITNRRIARADHLIFLLNAVEGVGAAPVLFNERHHRFGLPQPASAAQADSILFYLPWPAFQLALMALLTLFALGRRFGTPRPLPEKSLRSPVDIVVPAAAMWQKARARSLAVDILFQGLRRQAGRKYRLGPDPGIDEMAALAERVTGRGRRLWEQEFTRLAEAARSEKLSAGEMLAAARHIDRCRKELIK